MKRAAATELMNEQKKRLLYQHRKEQENSVAEDAKANFRRKPYYMKQDGCGNNLGGRD